MASAAHTSHSTDDQSLGVGVRAVSLVSDYFSLTKPKVQLLLLFTTASAMFVAGTPSLWLVVVTLAGGALSAGGAGAINHWYDRDIDRRMERTANRPVAAGRISPRAALVFGCLLGVSSFALLAVATNLLAALLSLSGFLGYVFIYTIWLKRRTPQNIVIGGAAGAVPPLVGWAAVTGSLKPAALYMFAIIFYWTPPHFWALSLLMKEEYQRVRIPMLPVVRGKKETRRQILLYTFLLVAVTFLPFAAHVFGLLYFLVSGVLNTAFLVGAWVLYKKADRKSALRLYLFSLLYLALLFAVMVVDVRL